MTARIHVRIPADGESEESCYLPEVATYWKLLHIFIFRVRISFFSPASLKRGVKACHSLFGGIFPRTDDENFVEMRKYALCESEMLLWLFYEDFPYVYANYIIISLFHIKLIWRSFGILIFINWLKKIFFQVYSYSMAQ